MSEHWEYFPCTMGESKAFIFYDHGIREDIDDLDYKYAYKVRATIKAPTDEGMPTNEEFDEITNMEDRLAEELGKQACIYVGRVTVDGYRYFTFYTNTEEAFLNKTVDSISEETKYNLGTIYESDTEKTEYWENLFPTKTDWRVILDMRVLDALEEGGDPLTEPRRIDHWAYFENEKNMLSFSSWLKDEGFNIENQSKPDDEITEYGVQFFGTATPNLYEITSITIKLSKKADEMSGDYDGWETSVEASDT